jgi:hypothetical protein
MLDGFTRFKAGSSGLILAVEAVGHYKRRDRLATVRA